MTDYGHELRFGMSLPPDAAAHEAVLALALAAEDAGLDLLAFQDHPYQPGFLDTWTLLSYLAARTRRVLLLPDVANLPLRPAPVLARSAASLDVLSGGRVELGVGAGYFLDAIAAMGGPRRTAAQSVDALDEAIEIIRLLWTPGPPVSFEGEYYRLDGAAPGPFPLHPIGIWVGAYKPRMLRLTGRVADGWVPSLGYAAPEELAAMTAVIDEAACEAGRDPAAIVRAFNISGGFDPGATGFLHGDPAAWAEQLTGLVLAHGMSVFVLGPGRDADADIRRFATEVAPAVREAVERERRAPRAPHGPAPVAVGDHAAEPAAGTQVLADRAMVTAAGRAGQRTLLTVHAHLRQELEQLRAVIAEVAAGRAGAAAARSFINRMTVRQNSWTLGAFCAAYCRVVSVHHAIEDQRLFRDLERADPSLGPVVERLSAEHEVIARVLTEVDDALVALLRDDGEAGLAGVERAVDGLEAVLLAHLDEEEAQLLEPIGRLGVEV